MKSSLWHALLLLPMVASAQYKIVEPDGRVTYTDRPPVGTGGKVTELRRSVPPGADPALAALPVELRLVVQRYPVTLYVASDCAPCERGRQMLTQRGIPFSERKIVSEEDGAAAERALGWRTVPSLVIGTQALRGFAADEWAAYLDAAGYPKESLLPRGTAAARQSEAASTPAPRP